MFAGFLLSININGGFFSVSSSQSISEGTNRTKITKIVNGKDKSGKLFRIYSRAIAKSKCFREKPLEAIPRQQP